MKKINTVDRNKLKTNFVKAIEGDIMETYDF
jgi:hypothetical protein